MDSPSTLTSSERLHVRTTVTHQDLVADLPYYPADRPRFVPSYTTSSILARKWPKAAQDCLLCGREMPPYDPAELEDHTTKALSDATIVVPCCNNRVHQVCLKGQYTKSKNKVPSVRDIRRGCDRCLKQHACRLHPCKCPLGTPCHRKFDFQVEKFLVRNSLRRTNGEDFRTADEQYRRRAELRARHEPDDGTLHKILQERLATYRGSAVASARTRGVREISSRQLQEVYGDV